MLKLKVSESLDWCLKVHELTQYKNKKAHILYGCAMCIRAKLQKQHAVQISFYEQALDSFKKFQLFFLFKRNYERLLK